MRSLAVIVIVLAACGSGTNQPGIDASDGDAPMADASTTDAIPDAAGTSVRVEAISIDGPLAGVTVAFLDGSNATLSVVTTAADGIAIGSLPAGGSVVAGSPGGDRAFLWKAVEAGDVLRARFDVTTAMHTVTFTLPPSGSGGTYVVNTRCGKSAFTSGLTVAMMLPTSCTSSDVIVQHYGTTGLWPHVIHVPAQALTAATVNLTAMSWTNTTSYQIIANGVTSNSAQLLSDVRVGDVFVGGHFYSTSGGTPVGTAQTTAAIFAATGLEVIARLVTPSGSSQLTWLYRGSPPPPAFDGGDRLIAIGIPTYNATTRTFAWSQGTTGDPVDGIRGTIVFNRPSLPALTWEIVSPSLTPTSVAIPPLPTELASVDPGSTAAASRRLRVYTVTGAYDRLRQVMFGAMNPDELLPQSGSLRISDSTSP